MVSSFDFISIIAQLRERPFDFKGGGGVQEDFPKTLLRLLTMFMPLLKYFIVIIAYFARSKTYVSLQQRFQTILILVM